MEWIKRTAEKLDPELIEKYQLSPIEAKLFSLREINTDEQLDYWFNATEDDLADPFLMHDMEKAVERINQAIDNEEKIMIYGDYDADGITATTIMMETLSILGANVDFFIPDRFKDGYGPSLAKYQEIVANGTNLIITVDNGVTGVKEVAYAQEHGVDVILTDHHTFQSEVPKPYALVHCNYPGQAYPFDDYCGAGVAYTICRALMGDSMTELLDLAMIGTLGDMVKVSGEGHIIVKRGLQVLNQTERPGLRALIANAGLQLGELNETDVGFNIAPRLNATGRLSNASLAVELLMSDSEEEAKLVADKIEDLNNQRKDLTNDTFAKCMTQVRSKMGSKNTQVIYDPSFHEGVLGLVANKVVETTHKPTIVLTDGDNGELKGSGRSAEGFNLFDALNPLKDKLLTKFGGHDFACGLSLEKNRLSEFIQAFEASYHSDEKLPPKKFDFELEEKNFTLDLWKELQVVGPFGTDNPVPVFSLTDPAISQFNKIGKDKTHVRMNVGKQSKLALVGFNLPYLHEDLLPYIGRLYIQLGINTFRNQTNLQGIIQDIAYQAPKLLRPERVIDLRTENYLMGFADKYLFFDKKNIVVAKTKWGIKDEQIVLADEYQNTNEIVALVDAPHNQTELDQVLTNQYQQLYLRFMLDQLPVKAIPNKTQFADVLKYAYAHPGLVPEEYQTASDYLHLEPETIMFILRVFFELGFIKLEKQLLVPVNNPVKQPLTNSKYLLATNAQLKFTKVLRNMPSRQLLEYVNNKLG